MKTAQSLPVLISVVPGQRWSCHSCGDCCRTLVGHITIEEKQRIESQAWEAELGVAPVIRAGRQWVLNKRPDGACVFLDAESRCMIHARFGAEAKPLACRIFPFSVRPTPAGMQVSLRFDCPSVTASLGEPLRRHRDLLNDLSELLAMPAKEDRVRLKGRLVATAAEQDGLMERIERWISGGAGPFNTRMLVLARFVCMLDQAKLRRVRGRRLLELADLLLGALPAELDRTAVERATARQQAMLRQFAFACSEHVSLEDLTSGAFRKLAIRREQMAKARQYLRGEGMVPPVRGIEGSATFESTMHVQPTLGNQSEVEDLLTRYLLARVAGRSVFGEGYYGWPVVHGLGALCLGVAAAGWIARHRAAAHGRDRLILDDVARALGIIDRAATRVPILGRFSERARVSYLMRDDGLGRLLAEYALTEAQVP